MSPQPQHPTRNANQATAALVRRGPWRLVRHTLSKAWAGNVFSEAAEAAFWQTLSLPPLLLGLLGSLGFVGEWFGQDIVHQVHDRIIDFCKTIFSSNAMPIVEDRVSSILTVGKGGIVG